VIAYEERKRGGADFVSFDKQAVRLSRRHRHPARLRG